MKFIEDFDICCESVNECNILIKVLKFDFEIMVGKSFFCEDVFEIVIKSIFSKYDRDSSGCFEKSEILIMLRDDMGLDER